MEYSICNDKVGESILEVLADFFTTLDSDVSSGGGLSGKLTYIPILVCYMVFTFHITNIPPLPI